MLSRWLDAIQRHPHRDQFEICVCDNHSPDDTADVVTQLLAQFREIASRFLRQPANVGFAGNFAAAARLATGHNFVIVADDDEMEDGALDLLLTGADLTTSASPLTLFDSLPGGDAVMRKMPRPSERTTIANLHDLLQKLGVFHASFVSNMMFHRETALAALTPAMLQSRYPHTALALTLLCTAPATFLPGRLVDVSLPPDVGDQPLLTCVDMARVMSDYALNDPRCRGDAGHVYSFLMKMLPTAIYQQRLGLCGSDAANPHADLGLSNVYRCYRQSMFAQIKAVTLWLIAHGMPVSMLGIVLRRFSRHPR
jgi:glycosyltransferase involved in cell wall biosynthesis